LLVPCRTPRSPADDRANLKVWLKHKKGKKVELREPKEGRRLELLNMADENAAQLFAIRHATRVDEVLEKLRDRLGLSFLPRDIGAIDVSTIAGSESVGAFVYWSDGGFKKDLYRRLRIRTVSGVDDYSMMHEAIMRTLNNLGDDMPDLLVVDGGKGQLEIARDVIEESQIAGRKNGRKPLPVAVAKDPDRAMTLGGDVINLEDGSPPSLLLRKIRDEAHRFAVTYHRKLRDKRFTESPLERIPGIGRKRRLELLRYFGSIEGIRNAGVEEIAGVKGLNRKIAGILLDALRRHE